MRTIIALIIASAASASAKDMHGFLVTGQSLCAASHGDPALTLTQPYSNQVSSGTTPFFALLTENGVVETERSPAANEISALVAAGGGDANAWIVDMTRNGCVGGARYITLKKGTTVYSAQLNYPTLAMAHKGSGTYVTHGVFINHGESEELDGTTKDAYKAILLEWQNDYDTSLRAITGQSAPVVAMLDQMCTWGYALHTHPTIALAQWEVARDNPTIFKMIGPRYQYVYYSDGVHMVNTSYREFGEMWGKVAKRIFVDGENWVPLSPVLISISGAVISCKMHVPTGVLAIDTTKVTDKGSGKGFEYFDDSGSPPAISSVSVSGDTATIVLASTPTGNSKRLRYAYTAVSGAGNGTSGAAHGNIRDTDPTVGYSSGANLYDWLVAFDEAIGLTSGLFPLPDSLVR